MSYNPLGPLSLIALSARGAVACRVAVLRCTRLMLTPDELQSKTRRNWGDVHTNTGKIQPRRHSSLGMQLHTQQSLSAFADAGSLHTAHSEPKNEREYTIGRSAKYICLSGKSSIRMSQKTNPKIHIPLLQIQMSFTDKCILLRYSILIY